MIYKWVFTFHGSIYKINCGNKEKLFDDVKQEITDNPYKTTIDIFDSFETYLERQIKNTNHLEFYLGRQTKVKVYWIKEASNEN